MASAGDQWSCSSTVPLTTCTGSVAVACGTPSPRLARAPSYLTVFPLPPSWHAHTQPHMRQRPKIPDTALHVLSLAPTRRHGPGACVTWDASREAEGTDLRQFDWYCSICCAPPPHPCSSCDRRFCCYYCAAATSADKWLRHSGSSLASSIDLNSICDTCAALFYPTKTLRSTVCLPRKVQVVQAGMMVLMKREELQRVCLR